MSDGGGLQISPQSELRFKFELRKQVPTALSLYNPSSERIAFKIKTTQPKRYSVRPSAGFVDPYASVDVKITMQSQKEYPPDINNCKDKFLVQSVIALPNETDVHQDMFQKSRQGVVDSKLKVVFDLPQGPPPTIHEPDGEENEHFQSQQLKSGDLPDGIDSSDQNIQLRRKIDALEKERNALRDKLSVLELQGGNRGSRAANDKVSRSQVRLIHLLLVAVVSFLIGHFL
eukprot:TRINITY_DN5030_c0_g1_i1.p1 TRINITY_DN5030_c0_g1~~TRINITY_DN5030_c0_g1_i1.p1  ORF type:complete len:230 (+),score=14.27 TRINITY_DN5030_c0_g1_i1:139-828(+)